MTDINEQVAVKLYNYLGNPHLTWATCNVRGQYRMIAKEIDSLYTPLIEQARQEGRRQVFEEHAAGKYAKAQLLKAQQHYREKLNEAFSKGYKLACDQLSKHYRKQIEGMVKLAAKGSPEYEKLREDIKVELKTFGCQWDLIGEEDPEDIASESADSILSLLKGGK